MANGAAGVLTGNGSNGVGLLAKERTIAGPGFNRWLVPPAALAIHLCIGMAYGFSVFWLPLSHAINANSAIACSPDMSLMARMFATTCDWKISELGWMFTIFFVFLGGASAIWGGWLERVGPRKAGFVAALCWCGGLLLGAIGVYAHQLWLLWVGPGMVGGIGLGLGYISPVSTLIKWFPDRRGMATGMAIMGFGGGAMIGAPLADMLMKHFATPSSVGVWETFVAMAVHEQDPAVPQRRCLALARGEERVDFGAARERERPRLGRETQVEAVDGEDGGRAHVAGNRREEGRGVKPRSRPRRR